MHEIRRKSIIKKMKNNSFLILYSGKELKASCDNNYPFYLDRNFYYLTNIKQENVYLIIYKINDKKYEEYIFSDEHDPKKEAWFGKKLTVSEIVKLSKIKKVYFNKDLLSFIYKLSKKSKTIYYDSQTTFDYVNAIIYELEKKYKICKIDIFENIRDLRMIKDESEIKNIISAIKITDLALKKGLITAKTAKYEYEVYNAFNHEALNHGTHELGFPSIIASGINATCLHYPTPYDIIHKNSLILNDVGASFNCYSSDITRTYPVNGKFDKMQKNIYEIVLKANKEVIKYAKPGLKLIDLQNKCKEILFDGLKELKLVNKPDDLNKYYFHNVSHHLGLDVHDVSDRERPLQEGNVITVEPGLYLAEYKIGIRIEDDILITKNGSKVLSKDVLKEINDIEKMYKEIN